MHLPAARHGHPYHICMHANLILLDLKGTVCRAAARKDRSDQETAQVSNARSREFLLGYLYVAGKKDRRSLARSLWTKSMVVLVASSRSYGKVLYLTPRRVSDSEERQSRNARSFSLKPPVERSLYLKVSLQ